MTDPSAPIFEFPPRGVTIALALGLVGIYLAAVWLGDYRGQPTEMTSVVTVLGATYGGDGRPCASCYEHRIRLADGSERRLQLDRVFSPGVRLKLKYREYRGVVLLEPVFYTTCAMGQEC